MEAETGGQEALSWLALQRIILASAHTATGSGTQAIHSLMSDAVRMAHEVCFCNASAELNGASVKFNQHQEDNTRKITLTLHDKSEGVL